MGPSGMLGVDEHRESAWPSLPLSQWKDTCDTLHLWTQMAGKVKLALAPPLNHWWQVTLRVCARGLTTSAIPYRGGAVEILFDLVDHVLSVETSDGEMATMPLEPRSVASFYADFMALLRSLNVEVRIWRMPVEIPDAIPFDQDHVHASYDPVWAHRFWRVLLQADSALREFAGRFQGKQSPVHFFWGSFDLASSRFSGRRAPPHPAADPITREAYSHEVMSFGFWPGGGPFDDAAFYAYAAPEPDGFAQAPFVPEARYLPAAHELVLPYETVRQAEDPREVILDFFQGVYDAGAILGRWDRDALDRPASLSPPFYSAPA